ncbi:MAG: transporter permease protein [Microbacteriaceae bacterium]|nr:transporter permease protein [Microbacteriaceae bacterium]
MIKTLGLRLLASLVLLIVVPTVTFFLQAVTPGNVAQSILGIGATPQSVAALDNQLGLDRPVWQRYLDWLAGFFHGDLGTSYITGDSVVRTLSGRLGVSLSLIVGALVVFTIVGVLLGILSTSSSRVWGRLIDVVSTAGIAIPNFWLGVLLIGVFAVQLNLLPATGYVQPSENVGGWIASLVLPVIALAFAGITGVAKQTRDQMLVSLASPYARSLRANGASEASLLFRHALRNASGPIITVIGLIFVGALSGSVVVENIFVLPGLGSQAVQSTAQRDLPVIQGIAVYFTIIVVVVNVVIDVVNTILNPKARAS